jgi:HEAT repeat protein
MTVRSVRLVDQAACISTQGRARRAPREVEPARLVEVFVVDFHNNSELDDLVAQLATTHRAQGAYRHLVLSGAPALPAVRRGLNHDNAAVRFHCVKALDHLVDEGSFPELIRMLRDDDWRVRQSALHALACDRCKENACRPEIGAVLPPAIRLLESDPNKYVRAMAVEVVGRWVHTDALAAMAIITARDSDSEPSVRKKAGWYAPGGPIHRRTRPSRARR